MLLELLYTEFIEWVKKSDGTEIKMNVKNYSEKIKEAKRRTIKKSFRDLNYRATHSKK